MQLHRCCSRSIISCTDPLARKPQLSEGVLLDQCCTKQEIFRNQVCGWSCSAVHACSVACRSNFACLFVFPRERCHDTMWHCVFVWAARIYCRAHAYARIRVRNVRTWTYQMAGKRKETETQVVRASELAFEELPNLPKPRIHQIDLGIERTDVLALQ